MEEYRIRLATESLHHIRDNAVHDIWNEATHPAFFFCIRAALARRTGRSLNLLGELAAGCWEVSAAWEAGALAASEAAAVAAAAAAVAAAAAATAAAVERCRLVFYAAMRSTNLVVFSFPTICFVFFLLLPSLLGSLQPLLHF